MTYKVTICWTGKAPEVHSGLTRAQAQALADYTARTYRVQTIVTKEGAR